MFKTALELVYADEKLQHASDLRVASILRSYASRAASKLATVNATQVVRLGAHPRSAAVAPDGGSEPPPAIANTSSDSIDTDSTYHQRLELVSDAASMAYYLEFTLLQEYVEAFVPFLYGECALVPSPSLPRMSVRLKPHVV